MKKLVRKTMFVLSFMGLFTFGAPKQAKAEAPTYPRQQWVCCPDGNCHCCMLENPLDFWIHFDIACGTAINR